MRKRSRPVRRSGGLWVPVPRLSQSSVCLTKVSRSQSAVALRVRPERRSQGGEPAVAKNNSLNQIVTFNSSENCIWRSEVRATSASCLSVAR